jgi:hypothetical protein
VQHRRPLARGGRAPLRLRLARGLHSRVNRGRAGQLETVDDLPGSRVLNVYQFGDVRHRI